MPGPAIYRASSSSNNNGGNKDGDNIDTGSDKPGGTFHFMSILFFSNLLIAGGMSGGAVAAIIIIVLSLASITAFGIFYYRKNGHIFGKSFSFSVPSSSVFSSATYDRRNAAYSAYVDNDKL